MPDAETDYLANLETVDGEQAETFGQMVRADSLARVEKRNRILALRRSGFSTSQIAEALSTGADGKGELAISPSSVRRHINAYVTDLLEEDKESVAALRVIDNERIEQAFRRLETDARSDDPKIRREAIKAQIKLLERHAKLNGLDAAQLHRFEGEVDHRIFADDAHVKRVENEFAARHGATIDLPAGDVTEEPEPSTAETV